MFTFYVNCGTIASGFNFVSYILNMTPWSSANAQGGKKMAEYKIDKSLIGKSLYVRTSKGIYQGKILDVSDTSITIEDFSVNVDPSSPDFLEQTTIPLSDVLSISDSDPTVDYDAKIERMLDQDEERMRDLVYYGCFFY